MVRLGDAETITGGLLPRSAGYAELPAILRLRARADHLGAVRRRRLHHDARRVRRAAALLTTVDLLDRP